MAKKVKNTKKIEAKTKTVKLRTIETLLASAALFLKSTTHKDSKKAENDARKALEMFCSIQYCEDKETGMEIMAKLHKQLSKIEAKMIKAENEEEPQDDEYEDDDYDYEDEDEDVESENEEDVESETDDSDEDVDYEDEEDVEDEDEDVESENDEDVEAEDVDFEFSDEVKSSLSLIATKMEVSGTAKNKMIAKRVRRVL